MVKTVDDLTDEEILVQNCLSEIGLINFRRLNDTTGYVAVVFHGLLAQRLSGTFAQRLLLVLAVFVAPALGFNKIGEFCTSEVNRLAADVKGSGSDAVGAQANLNLCNGAAYGGKGEMRQAAAFHAKGAQLFLKQRDFDWWANCVSMSGMLNFENGGGDKVVKTVRGAMSKAISIGQATAISLLIGSAFDQARWRSDGELAEMVSIYESELASGKALVRPSQLAYARWRAGQDDADECMRNMSLLHKPSTWVKTYIWTTDRVAATASHLDLYDWAVTAQRETLGGMESRQLLVWVGESTKFLEGLAKTFMYVRPWALTLRGCLQRRKGKLQAAMRSFAEGEEAAKRISR